MKRIAKLIGWRRIEDLNAPALQAKSKKYGINYYSGISFIREWC